MSNFVASWFVVCFGVSLLATTVAGDAQDDVLVIAHRGASGYAVEHSEAAKAMAFCQGADFIEQDVVLTRDLVFVVSHDITMEETTDVEEVYPDRKRADGRYYFVDFDWSEICKLQLHERVKKGGTQPAMANRFPGAAGQRVLRLEDEVKLIRGWNSTASKSTGKPVGLYIELKSPSFHNRELHVCMGERLIGLLKHWEVAPSPDACFIQCFEADELIDMKTRLACEYPLIQLVGKRLGANELTNVAKYAFGIGPSLESIIERDEAGSLKSTGFVEAARSVGLAIHPYTVRKYEQPRWSHSIEETHQALLGLLKVDGFFTDYPDLSRSAVDASGQQ